MLPSGIENYHVIDLVGEGSFGKVGRAVLLQCMPLHVALQEGHLQPTLFLGPVQPQVYKGRRRCTGQITAMKFIVKHGKSEKDIRNLRQEIEILRQLRHENIIQMLDAFETKTDFCVVTGGSAAAAVEAAAPAPYSTKLCSGYVAAADHSCSRCGDTEAVGKAAKAFAGLLKLPPS